jgi:hypothetical protein
MPWSVFFADGGIAFHSGSPSRSSAGCIHLEPADAEAWFNYLRIGDQVQVVKASEEAAARRKAATPTPAPAVKSAPAPPADGNNTSSDTSSDSSSDTSADTSADTGGGDNSGGSGDGGSGGGDT